MGTGTAIRLGGGSVSGFTLGASIDPAPGQWLRRAIDVLRHPLGASWQTISPPTRPRLRCPKHPRQNTTTCPVFGDSEYLGRDFLTEQARFVLPPDQQRSVRVTDHTGGQPGGGTYGNLARREPFFVHRRLCRRARPGATCPEGRAPLGPHRARAGCGIGHAPLTDSVTARQVRQARISSCGLACRFHNGRRPCLFSPGVAPAPACSAISRALRQSS